MDVTLVYKWGYDPEDAYIKSDGSFMWRQGRLMASDDDAQATLCARALAEAAEGTLRAVTIGNGDVTWAAARGAQELYVCSASMPASDDMATARMLADVVRNAGEPGIVVMANASESAGVAPALAALLGVPCVLDVRDFEFDKNREIVVAHRAIAGGVETLEFTAPVLIAVAAATSEKDVPTMKAMLAARKTPKTAVDPSGPASSEETLTVRQICKAPLKLARIFEGTPDEAAAALVETLRSDGTL